MHLLSVQGLTYALPDSGALLFKNIHLHIHHDRYCLTGRNGCGKSTLFHLIAGRITPQSGKIHLNGTVAVMPQLHELNRNQTIASFLGVQDVLRALKRMEAGEVLEDDLDLLDGKWDTETQVQYLLQEAGLSHVHPDQSLGQLSGGELSRLVFYHTIASNPELLLLDEPTNHLDRKSRLVLYALITEYKGSVLLISHDRELLRVCNQTLVLDEKGLHHYSVRYDEYLEQQQVHEQAINQQIIHARNALKKAALVKKETIRKQEKRNADGLKRAVNTGESKLDIDIKRGSGEGTLAKIKDSHRLKEMKLQELLETKEARRTDHSLVHVVLESASFKPGKKLIEINDMQIFPGGVPIWLNALNITVKAGEKWHIQGSNGSGKTTLLQLVNGAQVDFTGTFRTNVSRIFVIDQHLTILNDRLSLLDNLRRFAPTGSSDSYLRTVLDYFLFDKDEVFKPASALSGGERLRAALACLVVAGPIDLLILDEPVNNLDAETSAQLRLALMDFNGTMLIACHDYMFTSDIGISHQLDLDILQKSTTE